MREHVIRMTGNVADGYVLTEWSGHTRLKGIASYAAQDTAGADVSLEARRMAVMAAESVARTYGARVEIADGPAHIGRRGHGLACHRGDASRTLRQWPEFMRMAARGVRLYDMDAEDVGSLAQEGRRRRESLRFHRPAEIAWRTGEQRIGDTLARKLMNPWEWTTLASRFAGSHARPCPAWRDHRTTAREGYLFDTSRSDSAARRTGKLMRSEYGLQWVGRTPEGYPVDGIALFAGR